MNEKTEEQIMAMTNLLKSYLVENGANEAYGEEVAEGAASAIARFIEFREVVNNDHANDYGVALEYWNKENKRWEPSEIAVDGKVLFGDFEPYKMDQYYNDEMDVGMFANHGDAWWMGCDDWDFRLGVWEEWPTGDEPVFGFTEKRDGCGTEGVPYRLRRVIVGPLAESKKEWLLNHFN